MRLRMGVSGNLLDDLTSEVKNLIRHSRVVGKTIDFDELDFEAVVRNNRIRYRQLMRSVAKIRVGSYSRGGIGFLKGRYSTIPVLT